MENDNLESNENLQEPANIEGSQSPVIPPTNPPPAPPTNPDRVEVDSAYLNLLRRTIEEQNRRISEQHNSTIVAPLAPVQIDPDEARQQFYSDPQGATRKIIKEELEGTVGEIREFVRALKGNTVVDKLILQFKNDPRFSNQWDGAVEAYVREQIAQVPPDKLNEQNFGFLVVSAVGMKAVGMLAPSAAPTNVAPPTNNNPPTPPAAPRDSMPTPPHMRPSPPAGPTNNQPPRVRPLTENENRILREYNSTKSPAQQMTPEQYIKWQEIPASEVASTDFDKPKTPPARA